MADALHIQVGAEGAETEAQRQGLLAHGCARQRGHLHGRPMSALRFETWLFRKTLPAALQSA